jgi:7-cyano-7-deazaguanine synthase in queuosine biosynthesis
MSDYHFQLRTLRDQEPSAEPVILLDWFGGRAGTIRVHDSLSAALPIPDMAMDLFKVAGAVYCADRVARRPGTWTRSMELTLPVRNTQLWSGAVGCLAEAISFLSGDHWKFDIRPSTEPLWVPEETSPPVDAVCLFSGGLDSFTGALDLLAQGKNVCLVGHYEGGQAPKAQVDLFGKLAHRYGGQHINLRHLFLRPAPRDALQLRQLPARRETSTRSRSLLFLAAGLAVAAGYGPEVPLYIPENGFIGINVPLTPARYGSFSTRTTHPYFMSTFADCVRQLGIGNPILNPYRTMTKGEIIANCRDQEMLRRLARSTLSCSHPEAARYARRNQGNCGYCFPCLIRRASMHHVGLDDATDYAYDALREDAELANKKGNDLRALIRSLNRPSRPLDVLRNGPVPVTDISDFAGVYERGRREILAWMTAATISEDLRRKLPAS